MSIRIAINGFGRIGRAVARIALANGEFDIVAVNDLTDSATLAHLFKYDSIHGPYDGTVALDGNNLVIDGDELKVLSEPNASQLPWRDMNVDIVLECTGRFRDRESASSHLAAGAKKVIISAPGKGIDATIVVGVNESDLDPSSHQIISNGSCTTNCLAPVAKVLHEKVGIARGLMTTVHAYTSDQRLLDAPHKDLRRARAAAMSMVPTSTGAAVAVTKVLPELDGRLDGMAIRVPTPNVSLVDLVFEAESDTSIDEINGAIREAADGPLAEILQYSTDPVVSVDLVGNPHSSIFDAPLTKVIGGRSVKVLSWYDNEWGFSNRMLDLARLFAG